MLKRKIDLASLFPVLVILFIEFTGKHRFG